MMAEGRRRAYIRHPSDIPIAIATTRDARNERALRDVSFGGLSCEFGAYVEPGTVIWVNIGLIKPPFRAKGRVVWCRNRTGGYELGVEFMDAEDAFRARMVEQICHIEQYRDRVRAREGRELSSEQAAREWIDRFAADFPDPRPGRKA